MKVRTVRVLWMLALFVVALGVLSALIVSLLHSGGTELLAKTRDALRQQGYKTDLSQFDFSTSPEVRARLTALADWASNRQTRLPSEWPALTEAAGNDTVIVVWKQAMLKWPHPLGFNEGDQITWEEFREVFDKNQAALDGACQAAMSGPIRFNLEARHGDMMRLPHLAALESLMQALGGRTMLALHDGKQDAAWTNLMAATRLVTEWEPEPAEISHLARFSMMNLIFGITWQAMQAKDWPPQRLAQLQDEWEGVDFLKNLPETGEFKLACDAADYERERLENSRSRQGVRNPRMTFGMFIQTVFHAPLALWGEIKSDWNRARYLNSGQYEEERDLLLYDRDREIELRNAVQAPTWLQMSGLPGVTNRVPFHGKYSFGIASMRAVREIGMAFQRAGGGLLGHAAQAEAQRRILIAALTLERYRAQHGNYPPTLARLAPEFLKTEPLDFMNGRPLRYQMNGDGHYRLYSVGLDGVDDGGKMMTENERPSPAQLRAGNLGALPSGDIVWPFPAATATVASIRRQASAIVEKKADDTALAQAEIQWNHAASHQADAESLLAAPPPNPADVKYDGQPVSELLRGTNTAVPSPMLLRSLLTLKQVVTGDEPERVTFELPIRYDALKRVGELYLLIDTNNDDSDEGCVAQQMNCNRADNGDCLLAWDTIYESPGKHALRVGLSVHGGSAGSDTVVGPPLPFVVSNLCQFSISSAQFDPRLGAAFQLKLPESNGQFVLKCQKTNGAALKTITGSTTNGIVSVRWDLMDEQGKRCSDNFFNTVWTITLPDSGRTQILKGP